MVPLTAAEAEEDTVVALEAAMEEVVATATLLEASLPGGKPLYFSEPCTSIR